MKKIFLLFSIMISFTSIAQITVNGGTPISTITNSNVFLDASSSFSTEAGAAPNTGKGIVLPSVDLVNFAFDLTLADGFTFPTYFDGMVVYNNATGTTLTTGNRSSVATSVTPGYYYFSNPNGANNGNVLSGVWKPLGGVSITGTSPIALTSGVVSLNDLGITSIKIGNDAVTSSKILDGTIATADVANNAITGAKLETNISLPGTASMTLPSGTTLQRPVTAAAGMSRYNTTDNIMEYYNGTAWIRPTAGTIYSGSPSTVLNGTSFERAALTGDVTAAANSNATTIANDAVTSSKILNGTITSADINSTAGITNSQLANSSVTINGTNVALGGTTTITASPVNTSLTSTNFWVGNSSNQASAVVMSADATLANSGALTISNNCVTSIKIADATITASDLANNAVTTVKITDANVTTNKLADNAVTIAKLPTGATATTFLRGDGTWATPISVTTLSTTSSNISLDHTNNVIRVNASSSNITVTLPSASTATNRIYSIIKSDASSNKIIFSTSVVANGYSFTEVNIPGEYKIQSDGTSWYLVN
ncbi:hypothetical protein [Flavobacterium sp.]|uniref:beta strand repeat-containing protein n=1 Tax=Flavobacterium sp. TaxID=239 RepID=UPI00334255B9